MLFLSTVSAAFLSVPGIAVKFVNNADLAADNLILVSAPPCVFGTDCEVSAVPVELLAVALLLALLC